MDPSSEQPYLAIAGIGIAVVAFVLQEFKVNIPRLVLVPLGGVGVILTVYGLLPYTKTMPYWVWFLALVGVVVYLSMLNRQVIQPKLRGIRWRSPLYRSITEVPPSSAPQHPIDPVLQIILSELRGLTKDLAQILDKSKPHSIAGILETIRYKMPNDRPMESFAASTSIDLLEWVTRKVYDQVDVYSSHLGDIEEDAFSASSASRELSRFTRLFNEYRWTTEQFIKVIAILPYIDTVTQVTGGNKLSEYGLLDQVQRLARSYRSLTDRIARLKQTGWRYKANLPQDEYLNNLAFPLLNES